MYSIMRSLEYAYLNKINFSGDVLDIGGSKKSGYHELINGAEKIVTANINPDFGCDLVFDIQETFPLDDGSFDVVISLNVFEHIFNFQKAFSESSRVLKPGGQFVFAVPFMYQIHGSPDDFFRYTESALRRLLKENNFQVEKIIPLGYGLMSLNFQLIGGILPTLFLKNIFKLISVNIDKFFLRFSKRYRKFCNKTPLGYFVIANKE